MTNQNSTKEHWGCIGHIVAAIITGLFTIFSTAMVVYPSEIRSAWADFRSLLVFPTQTPNNITSSGSIDSFWVEHNVFESGTKGMRIYVTLRIWNGLSVSHKVSAYFSFQNGNQLLDYNNSYHTTDGGIAVSRSLSPSYTSTRYDDLVLFMPYDELHMASGQHDLRLYLRLYVSDSNTTLDTSDYYNFNVTQP